MILGQSQFHNLDTSMKKESNLVKHNPGVWGHILFQSQWESCGWEFPGHFTHSQPLSVSKRTAFRWKSRDEGRVWEDQWRGDRADFRWSWKHRLWTEGRKGTFFLGFEQLERWTLTRVHEKTYWLEVVSFLSNDSWVQTVNMALDRRRLPIWRRVPQHRHIPSACNF